MDAVQKVVIRNTQVVNLDAGETDCFIRLTCGSTVSIDTKIVKRLLGILEKENELKQRRKIHD